jgi:hypothetical protein
VLQHRRFLTGANYAQRIRTYLALGVAVAVLDAACGCGGSNKKPAAGGEVETGSTTATAPMTTGGIDVLKGAVTAPVQGDAAGSETALLERVALGRHEGYERVVFQFRDQLPGYRVEYVQPPLTEDGSGDRVSVQGDAFVVVRMEPASGFDLGTGEGVLVYKGPKRIAGSSAGTAVIRELARTGDFEAVLSWAIGLEERVGFRVRTTESPARLIVDFPTH